MPAGSADGLWPLAEAKLAAPRERSGLVDRPRILQVLDADTALTLVAAPPGFGKTNALRASCATRGEPLAGTSRQSTVLIAPGAGRRQDDPDGEVSPQPPAVVGPQPLEDRRPAVPRVSRAEASITVTGPPRRLQVDISS